MYDVFARSRILVGWLVEKEYTCPRRSLSSQYVAANRKKKAFIIIYSLTKYNDDVSPLSFAHHRLSEC